MQLPATIMSAKIWRFYPSKAKQQNAKCVTRVFRGKESSYEPEWSKCDQACTSIVQNKKKRWSWICSKHQVEKPARQHKNSVQKATRGRRRGGKWWNLLCWMTNPAPWTVGFQHFQHLQPHFTLPNWHFISRAAVSHLYCSRVNSFRNILEKAKAVSFSSNMETYVKKDQKKTLKDLFRDIMNEI